MFIPYGTNAPLYHLPIATVLAILASIGISLVVWDLPPGIAQEWLLMHGQGLRPWQWITSNFVHADWLHLIGNAIFLWCFGLIVEGKIGWARFLGVFLFIGAAQCFVEQLLMLTAQPDPNTGLYPASLGASSAIYGIMMMAVLWAPTSETHCLFFYGRGALFFSVSVIAIVCGYVVFDLIAAWHDSFAMTTPVLHLLGGVVGVAVGAAMLWLRLVDCEGWDLISVLQGKQPRTGRQEVDMEAVLAKIDKRDAEKARRLRNAQTERIADLIAREAWATAADGYLSDHGPDGRLPISRESLERLARGLVESKDPERAIPVLGALVEEYPQIAPWYRLTLAEWLITYHERPTLAIRVLEKLPSHLPASQAQQRDALIARAAEQRRSGVVEVSGDERW
jgi:membrane associated rhomboid family serine protease